MLNGSLVKFIDYSFIASSNIYPSSHNFFYLLCISSLPFPAEDDEESGGDADRRGPSHPGKGLSREQKSSLDMVKHVMLSLDEEDGLDQIYTFRLESFYQTLHASFLLFYFSL